MNAPPSASGPRVLPVFRGWTVDARLREFRKVSWADGGGLGPVEFLRFDSEEGDALLTAYIRSMTEEELDGFLASGRWP